MPFAIRSGVRQGRALSPTLFNYTFDSILDLAHHDYPGVQVGAKVHVSDLPCAADIGILSSSYSEMQGLFEALNCHAATVGMRINALKTQAMSALIPSEPLEGRGQIQMRRLDVRRKWPGHQGDQKQD